MSPAGRARGHTKADEGFSALSAPSEDGTLKSKSDKTPGQLWSLSPSSCFVFFEGTANIYFLVGFHSVPSFERFPVLTELICICFGLTLLFLRYMHRIAVLWDAPL